MELGRDRVAVHILASAGSTWYLCELGGLCGYIHVDFDYFPFSLFLHVCSFSLSFFTLYTAAGFGLVQGSSVLYWGY